jgi:hypothetical protein
MEPLSAPSGRAATHPPASAHWDSALQIKLTKDVKKAVALAAVGAGILTVGIVSKSSVGRCANTLAHDWTGTSISTA